MVRQMEEKEHALLAFVYCACAASTTPAVRVLALCDLYHLLHRTAQHSCGNPNNNCNVIIQYMCDDLLRDGTTTNVRAST